MQITDWLVVILVLAIVGVLLDAVRRRVLDRRNRIVVKLDRNIPPAADFDEELVASAELPNGGARTLPRQDRPLPTLRNLKSTRRAAVTPSREAASDKVLAAVPVLMDAVEVEEERIEHTNVFVDTGTAAAWAADNLDREQQFAAVAPADDDDAWDEESGDHDRAEDTANDVDGHYEEETPMLRQQAEHRPQVRDTRYQGGDDDDDLDLDDDYEDEEEDDEEDEEFDEDGLPLPDYDDDEEDDDFDDEDEDEDDEDDDFDDEDEDEEDDDEDEEEDEDDLDELEGLPEDEWGSEEEQDVLVDDYENEPVLLQDAYIRAAGHFSRSDPQPRIEPGFGDDQFNEDELNEDFSEAQGEPVADLQEMTESILPVSVLRRARPVPATAVQPAPVAPLEPVPASLASTESVPVATPAPVSGPAPVPVAAAPAPAPAPMPAVKAAAVQSALLPDPEPLEPAEKPVLSREAQPDLFQEEPRPRASLKPLKRKAAEPAPPPPEPVYSGPQEVIVINVMARPGQTLAGIELLPLLQQLGLRLGDMSIFHRHAEDDGSGPVLFSMANMVKPGTFDLATMDQFTTPGISFFMQMPNKYGNMACFDRMLHAASALRNTLEAELKDENRSVFTRQTVEHCRQRVRDFELLLLSKKQ